jgi:hypothetical protein
MSRYTYRILEVQDKKGMWNAVALPWDNLCSRRNTVVLDYFHEDFYDPSYKRTLVEKAEPIGLSDLSEGTRVYIEEHNYNGPIYSIPLFSMQIRTVDWIDRFPLQMEGIFKVGEGISCLELIKMREEITKIETVARYCGGNGNGLEIRVIFFESEEEL